MFTSYSIVLLSTAACLRGVVNGADGNVMIFDAMGRMVKSVSAEGAATVAMPAGYYIVRTAGTAKAVIVK